MIICVSVNPMSDYLEEVQDSDSFKKDVTKRINHLKKQVANRRVIVKTLKLLHKFQYPYIWTWLGIPIIKMPEDIMLIQEAFCIYKPTAVIEIGVARGGGVSLYHSLQKMLDITPNILGVDIKYFEHTKENLKYIKKEELKLVEGSSLESKSRIQISEFIKGHESIFVVLDGDHSYENVLKELEFFDEVLPKNSIILCSDTWISIVGKKMKTKNRKWNRIKNPSSALADFLLKNSRWRRINEFCSKTILSESPDGWIIKYK